MPVVLDLQVETGGVTRSGTSGFPVLFPISFLPDPPMQAYISSSPASGVPYKGKA